MNQVPEGATHYSEAVTDVYFPAYWKEGPAGCWAFVLDGRKDPEWTFHECCQIPARAQPIAKEENWTGEGLPPVDTVCLTPHAGRDLAVRILAYASRKTRHAHRSQVVLVEDIEERTLYGWVVDSCEFLPIRSAEQTSVRQLESFLIANNAMENNEHFLAKLLIEAGYRKVQS